jgi:pyruvate dehydrogenase E2 component (dihydrolipoamide acetyltransferase)
VETPGAVDEIAVHPVGSLSLSFDHRAFDGAYAARFIRRVKQVIEAADWTPTDG